MRNGGEQREQPWVSGRVMLMSSSIWSENIAVPEMAAEISWIVTSIAEGMAGGLGTFTAVGIRGSKRQPPLLVAPPAWAPPKITFSVMAIASRLFRA